MKKRKILLLFLMVISIFSSIYKQFMSFFDFILIVVAILILLEEKIGFLYFHFKKILISFLLFNLIAFSICIYYFDTPEYLNLIKSYISVVILKVNDFDVISKPQPYKDYKSSLKGPYLFGHMGRHIEQFRYLLKKEETIDKQMKLISSILDYEIIDYEVFQNNIYSIILEKNISVKITITDFYDFVIIKFK